MIMPPAAPSRPIITFTRYVCLQLLAAGVGTPETVSSALQKLHDRVADYTSGPSGQQTIAMLQQHACRMLAAALVGAKGVSAGQEADVAQRILDAGGVCVQPLFTWLWGGEEVAGQSQALLSGIRSGQLLSMEQSGMQVRMLVAGQVQQACMLRLFMLDQLPRKTK